jgi:hypothetical protein
MNAPLTIDHPPFVPWPTPSIQVAIATFQRISLEAASGGAALHGTVDWPRDSGPVETIPLHTSPEGWGGAVEASV